MPTTHEIIIGEDGRMRIPKAIRQQFGIRAGTRLLLETNDSRDIHLRVQSETALLLKEGSVLVACGEASEDLSDIVQKEREARMDYILTGNER